MEHQPESKSQFAELSKLYLFDELYKFTKDSPGLAIACAYLVMLLSSMSYLYVLFSEFDINILKYVTLEDILATPIKNPEIILIFLALVLLIYLVDIGNRWSARQQIKFAGKRKPFFYKVSLFILWAPKKRKSNLQLTAVAFTVSLGTYIYSFAKLEAEDIKEGQGSHIEITLAEGEVNLNSILLGSSTNFLFTYDHDKQKANIFYLEAIESIVHVVSDDKKPESLPKVKKQDLTLPKETKPSQ